MESIWGNIQGLLGLNQPQLNKPQRRSGPQIDLDSLPQTQIELPSLLGESNRVIQNIVSDSPDQISQFNLLPPKVKPNLGKLTRENLSEYGNKIQDVLIGSIARETGETFNPNQKQFNNGPGRGMLQMELGGYTYKDSRGKVRKNSEPASIRLKNKPNMLDVSRKEKYEKGAYDFYTDWLSKNKLENTGKNQIKFYMDSIEGKDTGYRIGNRDKIKKSFKEDSMEDALATFTRFGLRPKWSTNKKGNPKSLSQIKKHPEFKRTLRLIGKYK